MEQLRELFREANHKAEESEQKVIDSQKRETEARGRMIAADERAQLAERMVAQLEESLRNANHRAQELELRAQTAEERTANAEQILAEARERESTSNDRAQLAEQRIVLIEESLQDANHRAEESERRAHAAEQRAAEAEERMRVAETAAQVARRRLSSSQQHQEFWVVQKDEITSTGRELGRGGWAVVNIAKFRGLPVAAKQLHGVIISNYNRQLFVREMNIAAKIRHPNLLQFIGATIEGEPIILTELMATSLRATLEQGPLGFPHIVSICTDVSRALNYLHLMKPDAIIHRDISSANVLLDPTPNNSWKAKVSDYGSCNFTRRVTTTAPGNATYAAPEASNPAQQSTRMDVFSYGVLLIETCTQQFPDVDDREVLLLSIRWPALASLTTQCLKQEPANRPTMAEILEQLGRM